MGQGFYVSGISSASIEYDETIKVDDNSTNIFRVANQSKNQLIRLRIAGEWDSDETVIAFDNNASTDWDKRYDARKLFVSAGYAGYGNSYSKYTTISTKDGLDRDYSINSLPPLTSNKTIPVLAKVMATGSHSISAIKENYEGCVMLRDKVTGKLHDLGKAPYVFNISDTTNAPRFEVVLCATESGGPINSIEEQDLASQILIGQDANGAFVRTNFSRNTKATISAFNIVGQQIIKDVPVEGTVTFTSLNLNAHNQVVIIRVTTAEESYVQKIIAH
jgi:hypothetical protein